MKFDPRISIVTLGVADMARSRAFYEALGWTAAAQSTEKVTFFQGQGIVLGLYGHNALAEDAGIASQPAQAYRGTALAYNCANEQEVDSLIDHAVSCGGTKVKSPEKVFWGGYSGYFSDPDGHLWEVAHNPFASLDKDGHLQIEDAA